MALVKALTFESGSLEASDAFDFENGSAAISVSGADPIMGSNSFRLVDAPNNSYGQVSVSTSTLGIAFYFRLDSAPADMTRIIYVSDGGITRRWSVQLNADRTLQLRRITTLASGASDPLEVGVTYRIEVLNVNGGALSLWVAEGDAESVLVATTSSNNGSNGHVRIGAHDGNNAVLDATFDEIHIDNAAIATLPLLNPPDPWPEENDVGYELLSPNDARIFWSAVTNARRYTVEWSDDDGETWTVIDDIFDLFWLHIGRVLGTTYQYRIKAIVETGPDPEDEEETDYSEPVESPAPTTVLDTPATPTSGGEATETTITVAWGTVTDATSYDVRYSTDETNWTTLEDVTSPLTIEELSPATTYYVQVRGEGTDALSEWSDSLEISTTGGESSATKSSASISLSISIGD